MAVQQHTLYRMELKVRYQKCGEKHTCHLWQYWMAVECIATATLITDPRSLRPHLMEIGYVYHDKFSECQVATLISVDYVLTSASILHSEGILNYKVRKLKLANEEYSVNEMFGIKRAIPNELYDDQESYEYYNIGLIQLNETVPYLMGISIYRPACLWTDDTIRGFYRYSIYEYNTNRVLEPKLGIVSTTEACRYREYLENIDMRVYDSHVCFKTNGVLTGTIGSPIDGKVKKQMYVFGVATTHRAGVNRNWYVLGAKVSSFIEWIESIVWADDIALTKLYECGKRKVKHKALMTLSESTYHGEFPWHVALYKTEGDDVDNRTYICGGTIINNRTVLTAAHCVYDSQGVVPANQITIVAGTHTLNVMPTEARNYSVEQIFAHENYRTEYLENDIAILQISGLIEFSNYILPICLSTNYNNITTGSVAGWGLDELHQPTVVLRQGTFPIRSNFDCRDSNREFFPDYLNDLNFCAGYENGTNVCSGDSGSGMIIVHNSQWFIRGIVSLGVALPNSDKCDIMQMALFTDVPKFYDWITEILDNK